MFAEFLCLLALSDTVLYETIPAPTPGIVSSTYGFRKHPLMKRRIHHNGIDIAAPSGTLVMSSKSGLVVKSGWSKSFGWRIVIDHGRGLKTLYAHLRRRFVFEGDQLKKNARIGEIGATGRATGPHLHLEVTCYGKRVNPKKIFRLKKAYK